MTREQCDKLFEKIDKGIRRGAARAQAEHKAEGRPIVISKNGEIVYVPPEEISVPKVD